jgi:hypothetical protein
MPMTLASGGELVSFATSNAFDPFHPGMDARCSANWMAWLKAVGDGLSPRLVLNLEGRMLEFHILEPQRDLVRFLVALTSRCHWEPRMDILITRLDLVRAMYLPLLAMWDSSAFQAQWHEWYFIDSEPERRSPWPLRSPLLDAWVGQHGPPA